MTNAVSKTDQRFIMETALLECEIAEGLEPGAAYFFESKKSPGTWYIVDRATYKNKDVKTKVWFKKVF